ncbi:hypothetical protein BDY19DRAFT_966909 [Irpex rosettiformis]|uniref:Uncharacterized protein n=1 Tax=Irpex rosettiformis TaxID=378272 RepID=A0ACB8TTN2_9APHY|nr:hypothetical protein BDY19DRAFT_966909 [Irpex rosettiformis]
MTDVERGYARLHTTDSSDSLELNDLSSHSASSTSHGPNEQTNTNGDTTGPLQPQDSIIVEFRKRRQIFWDRLQGKGRRVPGWGKSGKNLLRSSVLNVFFIFIPFAWASHFMNTNGHWPTQLTFALCFLSIIPLEKTFDWGGEQMSLYLGKGLGDLVTITLNNAVEAALAVALLRKCELRLLQATIVGVVILHLLLIPGTAFLAGGAQILEQELHAHHAQLNLSLLAIGVLTILLPTALFASLDRGAQSIATNGIAQYSGTLLTDLTRDKILRMSRGLAVVLLLVYVMSRVFLHNPPGEGNALKVAPNAPEQLKHEEHMLEQTEPEINPWACVLLLVITVAIMAATAEFLVESIEGVRESGHIQEEWFGLILLPVVSFSADGVVAIVYFAHSLLNHITGRKPLEPQGFAKARAIDLSIQFTLFWMPFLVLLGWWINKPMHLLFDYFEVAVVLGSCFLVNYITADAKTNWVEGLIMVCFYIMIAICAWFYVGQPELEIMLNCPGSVLEALAAEAAGEGAAGEGGGAAIEHATRMLKTML